ncbi:MAG: hypothetical protein AB7J40_01580 [Candidatus Altimarinota bacterium]
MGINTPSYEDEQPIQPVRPAETKEHVEVPAFDTTTGAFTLASLKALQEETGWKGDFLGLPKQFAAQFGIEHGTEMIISLDGKTSFAIMKLVTQTSTSPNGFTKTTMLPAGIRAHLGVEKRKDPSSQGDAIQLRSVDVDGKKALWIQKKPASNA